MSDLDRSIEAELAVPELDEGWWTSVLSDEEAIVSEQNDINCRPCAEHGVQGVDWDCVRQLYQQDEVVLLEVSGYNRGGLLVQGTGIQGFVPISHLIELPGDDNDEEKLKHLANYAGKFLYLKVIECEPSNDRVVLSERAAKAGEGKRKELFATLKPGTLVCGVVTNLTEFGAFIDLGGVEGLIHVSEISWGRVENPADVLKVGQAVKVVVLQVNESNARIALSLKRLSPNPWEQLMQIYKPGDVVQAVLTSIMNFGLFARLPEGIEGLIHVSALPEHHRKGEFTTHYSPGQQVRVRILHMDADRRRLGLGLVEGE